MQNCESWRQQLMAYADDELGATERSAVEAHVLACAPCAAALQEESDMSRFLRARLRGREAAPASLRDAIRSGLVASGAPQTPWYARFLASRWTPRLALAVVLAVLFLVPVQRYLIGVPSVAVAAAARHACHGLEAAGDLPPCCTDLHAAPGDALGPPSAGASIPDLEPAGLRFVRAVHCIFDDRPVNLIAYRSADARSFSLYITDRGGREFKLLRTRDVNGLSVFQRPVPRQPGSGDSVEVALWKQGGFLYTLVGPAPGTEFEAALGLLQTR